MIRRWMRELPGRALWRIVETPPEEWRGGSKAGVPQGRGHKCVAVVVDSEPRELECLHDDAVPACRRVGIRPNQIHRRFDYLTARIGITRARRLCQDAAMREILRRQPSPTPEKREAVSV